MRSIPLHASGAECGSNFELVKSSVHLSFFYLVTHTAMQDPRRESEMDPAYVTQIVVSDEMMENGENDDEAYGAEL